MNVATRGIEQVKEELNILSIGKLTIVFLVALIVFLPCAFGIEVTVDSDTGSSTQSISAPNDAAVTSQLAVASLALSGSASGSGDFNDSHICTSTRYSSPMSTSVGVDLRSAANYAYTWRIKDTNGGTSRSVHSWETLDVTNAASIEAFCNAYSVSGDYAQTDLEITSSTNTAVLHSYAADSYAEKSYASAGESIDKSASGPSASGDFIALTASAENGVGNRASQSLTIEQGSLTWMNIGGGSRTIYDPAAGDAEKYDARTDMHTGNVIGHSIQLDVQASNILTGDTARTTTNITGNPGSVIGYLENVQPILAERVYGRIYGYGLVAPSGPIAPHGDSVWSKQLFSGVTGSSLDFWGTAYDPASGQMGPRETLIVPRNKDYHNFALVQNGTTSLDQGLGIIY